MPRLRSLGIATLCALGFGLGPAQLAAAPDPFYTDLLVRGRDARINDRPGAARMLRTACFGLLELPDRLSACLVELALAQSAEGNGTAFDETVRRLIEVESRFDVFAKAAIDPSTRAAFHTQLVARTPSELLESVPAFRSAAAEQRAARLERLDPAARRAEIERLIALEPNSERWRYELASMKLAGGDAAGALADLITLPAPLAGCRRAEARARMGDCAGADDESVWCTESMPASLWQARIGCHETAGNLGVAANLLAILPPDLAAQKPFRQASRRIAKQQRLQARQAERSASVPAVVPETNAGTESGIVPGPDGVVQTSEAIVDAAQDDGAAIESAPIDATPEAAAVEAAPVEAAPVEAAPTPQDVNPAPVAVPADTITRLRQQLRTATQEADVLNLLRQAESLRDQFPTDTEIQIVIGEVNYRLRRWQDAVDAIQGARIDLGTRPTLLFYYAVALYESGERAPAAEALNRALPNISETPFVREYVIKILGRDPG